MPCNFCRAFFSARRSLEQTQTGQSYLDRIFTSPPKFACQTKEEDMHDCFFAQSPPEADKPPCSGGKDINRYSLLAKNDIRSREDQDDPGRPKEYLVSKSCLAKQVSFQKALHLPT